MTGPAVLFGVAAATRIAYLFMARPSLEGPYFALADSLVGTGTLGIDGVPSSVFEPFYPFVLAVGRLLFGDRVVAMQLMQACIAALGAPLLYSLSLRLTDSRRVAIFAALMYAAHPLLVRQAVAATDLGLTSMLLVGFAAAFAVKHDARSAARAGLWLGIAALTRSMVLPVLMLAALILAARRQRRESFVLTLTTIALVLPMAVRNYVLSGSPWPGRSGINLYIGNSPHTAALLPTYDLDLLEPEAHETFVRARPDVAPDDPKFNAEFDAFLTREAIAFMSERPWDTIRGKIRNVAYLLSPRIAPYQISGVDTRVRFEAGRVAGVEHALPRPRLEIAAHAATSAALLVGCAAGTYCRRRELGRDAVLWAIFLTVILVNAVYVPATRYTAPMQFVMMFYASVALAKFRGAARA